MPGTADSVKYYPSSEAFKKIRLGMLWSHDMALDYSKRFVLGCVWLENIRSRVYSILKFLLWNLGIPNLKILLLLLLLGFF